VKKKLKHDFGEHTAEQRGWHWTLTSYAGGAWGKSKREVEEDLT